MCSARFDVGPRVFLLHINDMNKSSNHISFAYSADGTTIYASDSDISDAHATTIYASDSDINDSHDTIIYASESDINDAHATITYASDSDINDAHATTIYASDSDINDAHVTTIYASYCYINDAHVTTIYASYSDIDDAHATTIYASYSDINDAHATTIYASYSDIDDANAELFIKCPAHVMLKVINYLFAVFPSLVLNWHKENLNVLLLLRMSVLTGAPSKHRTRGPKPTEWRFLNVVTTNGLIQPLGNCSNHVLTDIRFFNMKFGWTKYNGNVMAYLLFKLCVPIRIIV